MRPHNENTSKLNKKIIFFLYELETSYNAYVWPYLKTDSQVQNVHETDTDVLSGGQCGIPYFHHRFQYYTAHSSEDLY